MIYAAVPPDYDRWLQITFCAAIFLTVALAVERYIAVCNPIAYRNALASHTVWYRTMGWVCEVQSGASPHSWCFVFFRKFRLPFGLHSSCSISPKADGTCKKHHEWGYAAKCTYRIYMNMYMYLCWLEENALSHTDNKVFRFFINSW